MSYEQHISMSGVPVGALAFGHAAHAAAHLTHPTVTPTSRHLTASIVVIDPTEAAVLLIWHTASGAYLFPGGHIDPDEAPHETALREVYEETGLTPALHHQPEPLTLPGIRALPAPWLVAQIPAPPKPARRGKPAEPAHTHIDLLYIATDSSRRRPTPEASGASTHPRWWPIDNLPPTVRAEVPTVAHAALTHIHDTNPTGDRP